jgi:alpha(1,3/1,4) fucosyltransferase
MTTGPGSIMLCIDPPTYHFERDVLFDPGFASHMGAGVMAKYVHLRDWFAAHRIEVHTADRLLRREVGARTNVVMSFGLRKRYRALERRDDVILSAFFGFESPVVHPKMYRDLPEVARHFKRVYSFSDSESLVPVTGRPVAVRRFVLPYEGDGIHEELFRRENRKFLVMINHNRTPALSWHELYTERMRAVEFFARTGEIDLYGRGWDGPSFWTGMPPWVPGTAQHALRFLQKQWERLRPDPLLRAARTVWKGSVPSKLDALGDYTFSLVFDNSILNGWVTEKIFDCLVVGTIPIFWGAPDVGEFVDPGCFIDMRRFSGYPELRAYLKGLGPREIAEYRANARAYLDSPRFRQFSKQAFTNLLAGIVEEDTGVKLR